MTDRAPLMADEGRSGELLQGDLFDLADTLQALIGGAVTIEDHRHHLLAYSANQSEMDQDRIETILNRRAPEQVVRIDEDSGSMRRLRRSERPLFIDSSLNGTRNVVPRVAMSIRADQQILGTIWVVSRTPLDTDREDWLIQGAKAAAVLLVDRATGKRRQAHLSDERMAELTSGAPTAAAFATEQGLGSGPFVVVAMDAPAVESGADRGTVLVARRKVVDAFTVLAGARHSGVAAGTIGATMFAVIAVAGSDAAAQVARTCEQLAEQDIGGRLRMVISEPVSGVEHLARARSHSTRALRALPHGGAPLVVAAADLNLDVALSQLRRQLDADGVVPFGAYAVLRDTDTERGTQYLDTVRTWLDCHGDIPAAALRMHVHHNTFRYRLNRIAEAHGIDLSDSRTRFEIDLQLRIFGVPAS